MLTPHTRGMASGGHGLTKFQKVKVLSARAEQLKNTEFPMIAIPPGVHDHTRMAELELEAGKLVKPDAKSGSVFGRDDDGHREATVQHAAE